MAAATPSTRSPATTTLTDDETEELHRLLEAQSGSGSLRDFIGEIVPTEPAPEHTRILTDLIERARRERVRACISWPPRHAKTVTILRGAAWWLRHAPADTCAYVSYSDTQARSKSRLCRAWARRGGVELAQESKNVAEWRTTTGGGLLAGGAGGGLTGQGISGLMIVDDPYKNRSEADSGLIRERIWEWFNEVVFTRLENASVIVVHTRWHEDDLIGRLSKRPDWEHVNLPAIAEEGDPLGRAAGEALWPERFPTHELAAIKDQIGEWSFAALYQGRPRPRGAGVFGDPGLHDGAVPPGFRIVIGADPAASESTRADYSAAVVLAARGFGPTAEGRVLEVVRKQVTVPAFVDILRGLSDKYGRARIAVEAVGGFKAIPQMLRQLDPRLPVEEVKLSGDKFLRAQPVAAAWNSGRVSVPAGVSWLPAFMDEVRAFTGAGDVHDDQVDALAHAWNAIVTGSRGMARLHALTGT